MKITGVECHLIWVDTVRLNWILTLVRTDAGGGELQKSASRTIHVAVSRLSSRAALGGCARRIGRKRRPVKGPP